MSDVPCPRGAHAATRIAAPGGLFGLLGSMKYRRVLAICYSAKPRGGFARAQGLRSLNGTAPVTGFRPIRRPDRVLRGFCAQSRPVVSPGTDIGPAPRPRPGTGTGAFAGAADSAAPPKMPPGRAYRASCAPSALGEAAAAGPPHDAEERGRVLLREARRADIELEVRGVGGAD